MGKSAAKELSESYFRLAGTELAMNFYSLFEGWVRTDEEKADGAVERHSLSELFGGEEFFNGVCNMIDRIFEGSRTQEAYAAELEKAYVLRKTLKDRTLALALYTDRFRIYEYLLNRSKPVDRSVLQAMDEEKVAGEIMKAIFASGDNATINDCIKLSVSQLPVRMTKAKFFDIINDSFHKYAGGEKSALDRGIYMLMSAAGIDSSAALGGEAQSFESLKELSDYFEGLDYAAFTQESYSEAEKRLKEAVSLIVDTTDLFQSLTEIINLTCVYLINYDKAGEYVRDEVDGLRVVIEEAVEGIRAGHRTEMSPEVFKCFTSIEGKLETMVDRVSRLESSLDEASVSSKLMSASVFVDIDEEPENQPIDETYILESVSKVRTAFETAFSEGTRQMNRARMAAALGELPVFFDSRSDVLSYIRDSITGCRDEYEKMISVRLVLDEIGR